MSPAEIPTSPLRWGPDGEPGRSVGWSNVTVAIRNGASCPEALALTVSTGTGQRCHSSPLAVGPAATERNAAPLPASRFNGRRVSVSNPRVGLPPTVGCLTHGSGNGPPTVVCNGRGVSPPASVPVSASLLPPAHLLR